MINGSGITHWCFNAIIYDKLHNINIDQNNENSSYIRTMPTPAWVPLSTDTWFKYIICFLLEYVGAAGSCIGIAAYDILCATFMIYIIVQLDYLTESLVDEDDLQLILR